MPSLQLYAMSQSGSSKVRAKYLDGLSIEIECVRNLRSRRSQGMHVEPLQDAHVIVVALGEELEVGDVMGPMWGRQKPTAISNPIFVDVTGRGFKANRDTLGAPLPVKGGKSIK